MSLNKDAHYCRLTMHGSTIPCPSLSLPDVVRCMGFRTGYSVAVVRCLSIRTGCSVAVVRCVGIRTGCGVAVVRCVGIRAGCSVAVVRSNVK